MELTLTQLTDEEIGERLRLYKELGSYGAVAQVLGIDKENVRRSLIRATKRGLTNETYGSVPEGYQLGRITRLVDDNGTRMEWQHLHPEAEALNAMVAELIETMGQAITPVPPISRLGRDSTNTLALYPVVDVHLGQLSWGKETGGNYDLAIAEEQFKRNVVKLMLRTENTEEALIEVLGDFYHADNNDAQTHKSKNHLDVDGRHDKVLHKGIELIIWMIDMALTKHEKVTVHVSRGNHDENASKTLLAALFFRYQLQDPDRVVIDREPQDLWVYEFGVTMLGFTHGDMTKAEDMPGVMAAYYAEMWGRTKERYAFSGHFHRAKKGNGDERNGAEWEILPAFTEKDAWNKAMGHASKRTIQSITFDKLEGRQTTTHVRIV